MEMLLCKVIPIRWNAAIFLSLAFVLVQRRRNPDGDSLQLGRRNHVAGPVLDGRAVDREWKNHLAGELSCLAINDSEGSAGEFWYWGGGGGVGRRRRHGVAETCRVAGTPSRRGACQVFHAAQCQAQVVRISSVRNDTLVQRLRRILTEQRRVVVGKAAELEKADSVATLVTWVVDGWPWRRREWAVHSGGAAGRRSGRCRAHRERRDAGCGATFRSMAQSSEMCNPPLRVLIQIVLDLAHQPHR